MFKVESKGTMTFLFTNLLLRVFEILVRSVKELFKKELQRANHEEIQTVLFEIEMFINNRPLNYIYPTDLEACLTPSHLLFGRYHVQVNKLISIQ